MVAQRSRGLLVLVRWPELQALYRVLALLAPRGPLAG